jgi:hypothetical protein
VFLGHHRRGRSPNATVAARVVPSAQDAHGQGGSNRAEEERLRILGEAGIFVDASRISANLPREEQGSAAFREKTQRSFLIVRLLHIEAREGAQTGLVVAA